MNQDYQTSQYQISIVKAFEKNATKVYRFGELTTTFPAAQFYVSSSRQLNRLLDCDSEFGVNHINGIIVPITTAAKLYSALFNGKNKERGAIFARTKTIAYDFETEYWYFKGEAAKKRKKAFGMIDQLPKGWEKLYTEKGDDRGWRWDLIQYNSKISEFFSNDGNVIKLVMAAMRFANTNLNASIIMPPTPMIIDGGASLHYCLNVNDVFNKYRSMHGIPKTVYYPIHKKAMDVRYIYNQILKQIQEIEPEIVIIGTIHGHEYIFPRNVFDGRKKHFEEFTDELGLYARTTNSIVMWYDKGDFCSSYGLKLVKKGFDGFISPLKGNYNEGGGGGGGPQYAYMLHDYAYYKWAKYLELSEEVPCEKECCKDLRRGDLEAMPPHQQWVHKQRHEIVTRNAQMKQLVEKLHSEGRLDDFEVRLKRNKIE